MRRRIWLVLATLGLLVLFGLMVNPRGWLDAVRAPADSTPARQKTDGKPISEWAGPPRSLPISPDRSGDERRGEGVDALMETESGKEIPGEKLVRFSSAESYRKFLAMAPPGLVLGQIDALHSARVKTGSSLPDSLAQAGGMVSGNFFVRVPEAPLEAREKGDAFYRAVGRKALDLIGADGVTDRWGQGVKVALLDTPVEGVEKVGGETAGHGTAMRSLIRGSNGPARGAAPGAEVLPFPVLDQEGKGSSFALAEAIVRATDQGVRVINMSLGSEGDSPVVRDAVAYALARNVVLVAAAGNEAVNRVSYPAAYEGVMAVASVDAGGNHLYFSNRGKSVDLAAPGFAVVADWPGKKNVEVTGTSASTALVTGAVAALLSRESGLSGKKVAELLVQYADATGLPGAAEETGGGVVNLQRVLNRNQRGVVDVAVGGVIFKEEGTQGRILVGIQNLGTESVNSPVLEITAGRETRKFYLGSLAPGQTAGESVPFDLMRARQEGGISAGAAVSVRGDQRPGNDLWTGYFRISKEKQTP